MDGPDARNASKSVKSIDSRSPGSSLRDLLERLRHRISAELRQQEDPGRARLLQHVLELARLVRRVDRHQDQAGQRRAELDHLPLGDVGRPHRDALAGREASEQRAGTPLGVLEQLAVRPAPALLRIRVPADQRGLVGHRLRSVAQDPPDRRVQDRLALVRGVVRLAQRVRRDGHLLLPSGSSHYSDWACPRSHAMSLGGAGGLI